MRAARVFRQALTRSSRFPSYYPVAGGPGLGEAAPAARVSLFSQYALPVLVMSAAAFGADALVHVVTKPRKKLDLHRPVVYLVIGTAVYWGDELLRAVTAK